MTNTYVLGSIASISGDLAVMGAAAIALILAAWVALSGLGFAKRRFSKYITGKKF